MFYIYSAIFLIETNFEYFIYHCKITNFPVPFVGLVWLICWLSNDFAKNIAIVNADIIPSFVTGHDKWIG